MTFMTANGLGVVAARPTPPSLPTADQFDRWRDELWRQKHEHGVVDPVTGRNVRLSVRCIAALYMVSKTAVHQGIGRARVLREELARALADA